MILSLFFVGGVLVLGLLGVPAAFRLIASPKGWRFCGISKHTQSQQETAKKVTQTQTDNTINTLKNIQSYYSRIKTGSFLSYSEFIYE